MMRIVRFEDENGQVVTGAWVDDGRARRIEGDLFGDFRVSDEEVRVGRRLAPVRPTNVVAIGLNYRRHAVESGASVPDHPLVFAKLTTSVIGPGEPIILPREAPDEVDYEAELAVVIGRRARRVSEQDALGYVLGYMCANDVSARDCQRRIDLQWTRAKSFDTFGPLGPWLVVDRAIDPDALRVKATINGQTMQDSNTSDMIFSVPQLVSYLSRQFTLVPGTVILTGTPEGVGMGRQPPRYLREGDEVSVEVEGLGTLRNPVVREP
jgi:2-keto-4-pentenoate hydratase/2-oxohepta-3-ene-1,7-dioic acid hydratase in catechol pathway